ncbi:PaaI family thioesterase [Citricoccus sp. NPDC055426]|uniref:PaaI family thioesterase n=1 Tax=Citricoccus sp. NPDC055426 TaxID=3155536 RepID=UPI00343BF0FD
MSAAPRQNQENRENQQTRETVVRWEDTAEAMAALPELAGLEFLRRMISGDLPGPPISGHVRMDLVAAEEGRVVFRCEPDESHYNPIGAVHGGLMCTVLDSALGCAAHSTLPAGMGYTSIDLTVNYLRPVRADSGPLTCTGTVIKPGRRVVFAEAEMVDAAGRAVATATGSLLVFPIGPDAA